MLTNAPVVAAVVSAFALIASPARADHTKIVYHDGVAVKVLASPDSVKGSTHAERDHHAARPVRHARQGHTRTVTRHTPRHADRFGVRGQSPGHAAARPKPKYRVNPKFSARTHRGQFGHLFGHRGFQHRDFGHGNFRHDRFRSGHGRNFVRPGFRSRFNNRGFSRGFHRGSRFGHARSRGRH